MPETDKDLLRRLFDTAVAAAKPEAVLAEYLPPRPASGRVLVVAVGKAAAAMAAALEQAWGPCEGVALTRYGHAVPTRGIEVIEAAHPVPDAAGAAAAARILDMAKGMTDGDTFVVLMSGGASALLSMGLPGISLDDKAAVTRALLASGANIGEMNTVRRHVSAIKGGRLAAAAYPARCLTFAISDVPGDLPEIIGSGPTVADPTSQADARAVLAAYGIDPPASVAAVLNDPGYESPKPGDAVLSRAEYQMIATPQKALEAAAAVSPLPCHLLGDAIEGEAREVGQAFAGLALGVSEGKSAFKAPCILLSGGETTVTLPRDASGRGGRNVEFLMGFVLGLGGREGITALAGDTDGVDGAAEVAGAVVDDQTAARAKAGGYSLEDAMANFDGHGFFEALDDQVVPGPTNTNVNDFRAILIRG